MKLQATDLSSKHITVGGLNVLGPITGSGIKEIITSIETSKYSLQQLSRSFIDFYESLSSDGIISPQEKISLKRELEGVDAEYPVLVSQANEYGVSQDIIDTYESMYAQLSSYLNTTLKVFDDMTLSTEISSRAEFNRFFDSYVSIRSRLQTENLNAVYGTITTGNSTYIPDDVSTLEAIAYQKYIQISFPWSGKNIKNSIKRFIIEISKDNKSTWTTYYSTGNIFQYYFDRDVDSYPDITDFEKWFIRVKAENIYSNISKNYGPSANGVSVVTTNYVGWTPVVPSISLSVNGRGVTIGWSTASSWFGKGKFDIQIAKGYTVASGAPVLITDFATLDAYAPAVGIDPRASYDNYKSGELNGYLSRDGSVLSISVPLYGQNETPQVAVRTPYYVRVRASTDKPTTVNPSSREVSGWSEWNLVYGEASTAQDVVENAINSAHVVDGAITAQKINVAMLAAISANIGVITDGAFAGSEYNRWALTRVFNEDGSVRYYEGALRVGGESQYLKVNPIVVGGEVTDYEIDFRVGNFTVTAVGSVVNGAFEVRNASDNAVYFKIDPSRNGAVSIKRTLEIGPFPESDSLSRLSIKEDVGVSSVAFTGTGEDSIELVSEGEVEGEYEVQISSISATPALIGGNKIISGTAVINPLFTCAFGTGGKYAVGYQIGNSTVRIDIYNSSGVVEYTAYQHSSFKMFQLMGLFQQTDGTLWWTCAIAEIADYTTVVGFKYDQSAAEPDKAKTMFQFVTGAAINPSMVGSFGVSANLDTAFIANGTMHVYSPVGTTNGLPGTLTASIALPFTKTIYGFVFANGYYYISDGNKIWRSPISSLAWTLVYTNNTEQTWFGAVFDGTTTVFLRTQTSAGKNKIYRSLSISSGWAEIQSNLDWSSPPTGNRISRFTGSKKIIFLSKNSADAGRNVYTEETRTVKWRAVGGSFSSDIPVINGTVVPLTGTGISISFRNVNRFVTGDKWTIVQGAIGALSVLDSANIEQFRVRKGVTRVSCLEQTIVTASGTLSPTDSHVIVNSTASVSLKILAGLPVGKEIDFCVPVSSAASVVAVASGNELIEDATSFVVHGAKQTASVDTATCRLKKVDGTTWRFVDGVISGSNANGSWEKLPTGYGKVFGIVTPTTLNSNVTFAASPIAFAESVPAGGCFQFPTGGPAEYTVWCQNNYLVYRVTNYSPVGFEFYGRWRAV